MGGILCSHWCCARRWEMYFFGCVGRVAEPCHLSASSRIKSWAEMPLVNLPSSRTNWRSEEDQPAAAEMIPVVGRPVTVQCTRQVILCHSLVTSVWGSLNQRQSASDQGTGHQEGEVLCVSPVSLILFPCSSLPANITPQNCSPQYYWSVIWISPWSSFAMSVLPAATRVSHWCSELLPSDWMSVVIVPTSISPFFIPFSLSVFMASLSLPVSLNATSVSLHYFSHKKMEVLPGNSWHWLYPEQDPVNQTELREINSAPGTFHPQQIAAQFVFFEQNVSTHDYGGWIPAAVFQPHPQRDRAVKFNSMSIIFHLLPGATFWLSVTQNKGK